MADTFGKGFETARTALKQKGFLNFHLFSAEDALLYIDGDTNETPGIPCPENGVLTIFLIYNTDDAGAGGVDTIVVSRTGTGNVTSITGGSSVSVTDAVNTTDQSVRLTSAAGYAAALAICVFNEIDRSTAPYAQGV